MNHADDSRPAPGRPNRRALLRAALALGASGLLAACQLPVPGQGPPPELYRLTPKSTFDETIPRVDWQLLVETPYANSAIDSTRIALQPMPTRLDYYARANWTDRAPLMVQALMVESFENSNRITAVGRDAVGLRADFILKSELREFQAEYFESGAPQVHVAVTARLIEAGRRAIVAVESFDARVPATEDSLAAVLVAFDEALGKVLKNLVAWTLVTGEREIGRR